MARLNLVVAMCLNVSNEESYRIQRHMKKSLHIQPVFFFFKYKTNQFFVHIRHVNNLSKDMCTCLYVNSHHSECTCVQQLYIFVKIKTNLKACMRR